MLKLGRLDENLFYITHSFQRSIDENYKWRPEDKSAKFIEMCSVCGASNIETKCGECGGYLCNMHYNALCPACLQFALEQQKWHNQLDLLGIAQVCETVKLPATVFVKYKNGKQIVTSEKGLQKILGRTA